MSFKNIEVNLETFIDTLTCNINSNNEKISELLAAKSKTYANFVKPLEMLDEYLGYIFTPLSHINSVQNTKETQDIYTKALPIITEYSTNLSQNLDIYEAFKEVEKEPNLNDEQRRVIELNILNFELSGAALNKEKKSRLSEINLRKSELANEFSQNLIDATNEYELIVSEDDVDGMSENEKQSAAFDDNGETKYKFTLQMPSYIAYMTYGKNSEIREKLYKAYTTRS
ncbi:MAG: M3 family peptidase, partial [Campylobacterota bacterium]|nr:M3 family peptidase [Campylobacterota bacterium]